MRKLPVLAVAIIVVLVVGGVVSRAVLSQRNQGNGDAPVFTSDYTLETIKTSDLFVIADTAHLLTGSRVEADASLIGRSGVTVDGTVDGVLTVMGGAITLGQNTQINGDASLIGNSVTLAGHINGDLTIVAENLTINSSTKFSGALDICAVHLRNESSSDISVRQCGSDELAGWQTLRTGMFAAKPFSGTLSLTGVIFMGVVALGLSALAGLIVTIFPRAFGFMTQAIRSVPARAARIGCITQVLALLLLAGVGVLVAVLPPLGLILLPISALLLLPLGVLFVVGWMTMALLTGDWLLRRFARRHSPPMLTVIAGSLGLFLVWTLLSILPFGPTMGGLMLVAVGTVGMGAAMMTRVGTRSPARTYFVQG